jgi:type VI secretion system protein VasD
VNSIFDYFRCKFRAGALITSVFILSISACSLGQQPPAAPAPPIAPKPILITLDLKTGKHLNPDIEGRASPVVVRIYLLENRAAFDNSDFFALYENDQSLLAKDIKYREELEIKPDQKLKKTIQLQEGGRYLAIFAAFRDLDHAQWKTFYEIKQNTDITINVVLDFARVSIDK